jgi:NAD(P)-dependent dehydrogenase (short-subunit alcohol dehydrogenase family)
MKRLALVTGNHTGIGKAISDFLMQSGYEVPMIVRSREYDLTKAEACQRLSKDFITEYGQIDLLVNNVGNYEIGYIDDFSIESWKEMFASNTDSVFFMTKYLIQELRKTKGKIINIGFCGLEKFSPPADHFAYQAAKTALLALTKAIAKQEASANLTVNMISPGSMENTVETIDCLTRIPMNRLGTLDELCQIVKLIIENDYLTGQNIEIAGGRAL